jgi:hypothetical protein
MSRFTTVIAKFLQIPFAFLRAILQTVPPLPAEQANLKRAQHCTVTLVKESRIELQKMEKSGIRPTEKEGKISKNQGFNTSYVYSRWI